MNQVEHKRHLLYLYAKSALELLDKKVTVDDYDVCSYSEHDFNDIAQYRLPLLNLTKEIFDIGGKTLIKKGNNLSVLDYYGVLIYEFSFIVSESMTFSGTIGIREINRDFGFSKHLDYLSLFIDRYKLDQLFLLSDIELYGEDSEELLSSYKEFYNKLEEYFSSDTMSLYSLLTGIKQEYNVPDTTILFDNDTYIVLDMRKVRDKSFINDFAEKVQCTSNTLTPMLKIEFDGNKILHIRTKMDKKNNKFKLRFFIETTSKFLNLFKTTRKL